jgi:hypothetical protein
MRVMVIVKATKQSEQGILPSEKLLAEMGKYNEELVKAGVMLAGEGLQASSKGKRVKFSGSKRTVVDGPFSETKELIAGFWLWQVKSMDEAVEWVKRCPDPMPGEEAEIEIRQVFETEDFAASDPSGQLRAQENELRRRVKPGVPDPVPFLRMRCSDRRPWRPPIRTAPLTPPPSSRLADRIREPHRPAREESRGGAPRPRLLRPPRGARSRVRWTRP